VVVRVKDSGIGIEPSMLTSIFDLFVQGSRTKDRGEGGLGLGLALVRNLVLLHGGRVTAHSEGPGRGSELVVELPSADDSVEAPATPTAPATTTGREGKARRVLVVDDNLDAAELLAEALQYHGYVVATAPDGPRALELLGQFKPEVAILDIGLPVMDGLELARRIRERDGQPPVKLIAATGYGQEADRILTQQAGFAHHLVKPIGLDELVQTIEGDGG
jgi:CheY-like chemotaxis protein